MKRQFCGEITEQLIKMGAEITYLSQLVEALAEENRRLIQEAQQKPGQQAPIGKEEEEDE